MRKQQQLWDVTAHAQHSSCCRHRCTTTPSNDCCGYICARNDVPKYHSEHGVSANLPTWVNTALGIRLAILPMCVDLICLCNMMLKWGVKYACNLIYIYIYIYIHYTHMLSIYTFICIHLLQPIFRINFPSIAMCSVVSLHRCTSSTQTGQS